MSMPPCFALLNTAYWAQLITQINAATTPAELQALTNEIYANVALLNSTIAGQVALFGPIEALLTSPTNLATALTWIENFITGFLTPYYAPAAKLAAEVTAIEAQVATMTAAINAVAALKFPGVTISIPSVAPFCTI
jgi:hypothetical protein